VTRLHPSSFAIGVGLAAWLAACGAQSESHPAACGSSDAIWISSDYSSSAVGSFTLSGAVRSTVGAIDLGGDPVLATSRGRAFYVARDLDAVFELDPVCGTPTTKYDVHLPGGSSNSDPYDVAVASDGSLWVPLYLAAAVLVLAPDGTQAATIDLSAYDPDGNPEAAAVVITDTPAGEKAFVALDRLDPYPTSVLPSQMLRIDVATRAVEAIVPLAGRNPVSPMKVDGGVLWLADPGNFDDATETDAGVERFDTATSTTALVVHEADLGGSVAEIAPSPGCGVAIVADATPNVNATSLALFDPGSGSVVATAAVSPLATDGFDLEGLAWSGGALLVGDRRRAPDGYPVHAFDGACSPLERSDTVFLPLPPIAFAP
jgi:hypothetical protein